MSNAFLHQATINSIEQLLPALEALAEKAGASELTWFRGHANGLFKLSPSLARLKEGVSMEAVLSKRFKQNAFPYRQTPPQSDWEWLFLMQHFGVPTRLLDWTESPLVALFFVVHDESRQHEEADGHLWALLPSKYNFELPRLRPSVTIDIPCFGVDAVLDDYRPDRMALENMTNRLPAAAIAHRQNERIAAQLGVFTIAHRDSTPLEELAPQFLARFLVPAGSKPRIRKELQALRITRMSLFPELASVALLAKEILT